MMLRLFNRNLYNFSNRSFDLAVIGGGPGGTASLTKATSLPSRLLSSA